MPTHKPSTATPTPTHSSTYLKEARIGIKAAGIEDGILPLVESGNLGFQILMDTLQRQEL